MAQRSISVSIQLMHMAVVRHVCVQCSVLYVLYISDLASVHKSLIGKYYIKSARTSFELFIRTCVTRVNQVAHPVHGAPKKSQHNMWKNKCRINEMPTLTYTYTFTVQYDTQ